MKTRFPWLLIFLWLSLLSTSSLHAQNHPFQLAGQIAPPGLRMNHAGAIVGVVADTAAAKMAIMRECGVQAVDSPVEIGDRMLHILGGK